MTLTVIARIGFAASELMHLSTGYIAIRIALHHSGESYQSSAFAQLTKLPGGMVVIWVTVAGLTALALWLLLQAGLGIGSGRKNGGPAAWFPWGKGAAYSALAFTALSFALRQPTSSATTSTCLPAAPNWPWSCWR